MSKEKVIRRKMTLDEFMERNRKSNGYLVRKIVYKKVFNILRTLLLFGLCFLIIQPLLNKLTVSFMAEKDLYDATVISIPRNFTTSNYKLVTQLINFWKSLYNSVGMAFLVSILQIISCTLVGYGFARFKFPLKNLWFMCVMLVIIVPPQTIMSSLYLHFRFFDVFGIYELLTGSKMNLLDTTAPYLMLTATCMGLKSGLYIFMIRQYFRGVPKELEEAAYVDGSGRFRTFLQIMLADAKPILTSCFLFAFVWQWTDSFYSSLFLRKLKLLPTGIASIAERLNDYYETTYGRGNLPTIGYQQSMIATGMLMTVLPLLLLYIIAQKGFVESLSQTGIKM